MVLTSSAPGDRWVAINQGPNIDYVLYCITGHLKYELISPDSYPADQFGTVLLIVKRKGLGTRTVNHHKHHKQKRQSGNIPFIMSRKMWFWLLQIQDVPLCRSPQSWPHPSLLTEEQRPSPRGEAAFLCLRSSSRLQGKTRNKHPLCL